MITTLYKAVTYTCLFVFLLASCGQEANNNSAIKNSDFKELCKIYQDIPNSNEDLTTKEMILTENVLNKLPTLFNKLFVHINNNNADKRYELIQQYAKQQNQLDWECKAASIYYSTNFK